MTISDTLGDLLTRIRNSQNARFLSFNYRASKLSLHLLDVLKKEGYIRGYEYIKENDDFLKRSMLTVSNDKLFTIRKNRENNIIIFLKYVDNKPVIKHIERVSRPGCRIYTCIQKLPKAYNGLGIYILSTSKGILSDKDARDANVGGEILCKVL